MKKKKETSYALLALVLTAIGLTATAVTYPHVKFATKESVKAISTRVRRIDFNVCVLANKAESRAAIEACKQYPLED